MIEFGVVTHGGVGSSPDLSGACANASEGAFRMLESGESALDAAVEALRLLEDDGRFNAGTGSILRLDGVTREMDAAAMDSTGRIGIVISIREIKNPILVARAVIETPHVALSGEGATKFAIMRGFTKLGPPPGSVVERYNRLRELIITDRLQAESSSWQGHRIASLWNFTVPFTEDSVHDTIGAVALDRKGFFAAATSTGGTNAMLLGRVGDSPMPGCGFYSCPSGAVAATGLGEEIIRKMLAKTVSDLISAGMAPSDACKKGVALFPDDVPVGLIAMSRDACIITANRQMAGWALVREI